MERRLWLETEYEPFDKPGYTTALAPYCLRTFRGRCYVVGLSERHNGIRTFALDRIARARITERTFRTDSHFSAARYFANSFGAYGGMDLKAEHIVIDADTRAAAYLRTRPLHDSQREVCRADSTHRNKPAGEKRRQHSQETPLKNIYRDNNTKEEEYPYRFEMDVAISADFVRELLYYGNEIRIAQPAALQEITAVMMETARKGMWNASEEQLATLSELHTELVEKYRPACSGFVCDNAKLRTFIASKVDQPAAEAYNRNIDAARQVQIEEQTDRNVVLKKEEQTRDRRHEDRREANAPTRDYTVLWVIGILVAAIAAWLIVRRKQNR